VNLYIFSDIKKATVIVLFILLLSSCAGIVSTTTAIITIATAKLGNCTFIQTTRQLIQYASEDDHNVLSKAQRKLTEFGYKPGPIDGILGKKTEKAIKRISKRQEITTYRKVRREDS
jgi:hypothetical protein